MPTILLTRPQASSELLAFDLQDAGYQGVIEPLLTIVPTPTPRPIGDFQAVMITSANAIDALKNGGFDDAWLLGIPCFCVGSRTADKARAFGFKTIRHSAGDGSALAKLMGSALADKNAPILHIAGEDTDSRAADGLRKLGFAVEGWIVYTACPARQLSKHVVRMLREQKIDAVLLFSARTAATFVKLVEFHALEACCRSLIGIGLSEAVVQPLQRLSWRKLLAAAQPSEEALIARLKEALPVS